MRTVKTDKEHVYLPSRYYVNKEGVEVTLIGAIHLADRPFFEDIRHEFLIVCIH